MAKVAAIVTLGLVESTRRVSLAVQSRFGALTANVTLLATVVASAIATLATSTTLALSVLSEVVVAVFG